MERVMGLPAGQLPWVAEQLDPRGRLGDDGLVGDINPRAP